MTADLRDKAGRRKYLVERERKAFIAAAKAHSTEVATFCLTLAVTGARISEVLALTGGHIDIIDRAIVFETLKQRSSGIYRAVPVPRLLISALPKRDATERVWGFQRTTAWKHVQTVMCIAGIARHLAMPKALRHSFAISAVQRGVPLNVLQRWLGHARLETTAIYANVLGAEERELAARTWRGLF
jgi:integrase